MLDPRTIPYSTRLPADNAADDQIAADIRRWRGELPLTADQLAFLALRTLFGEDVRDSGAVSQQGNPAAAGEA